MIRSDLSIPGEISPLTGHGVRRSNANSSIFPHRHQAPGSDFRLRAHFRIRLISRGLKPPTEAPVVLPLELVRCPPPLPPLFLSPASHLEPLPVLLGPLQVNPTLSPPGFVPIFLVYDPNPALLTPHPFTLPRRHQPNPPPLFYPTPRTTALSLSNTPRLSFLLCHLPSLILQVSLSLTTTIQRPSSVPNPLSTTVEPRHSAVRGHTAL